MLEINPPVPLNEMERTVNLSEFNLDYSELESHFKDLARLTAKIAGTPVSLINLIDSYTVWTITNHGLETGQMPREDSICQYTILNDYVFEVKDLTEDERFKDKLYVTDAPNLRYYLGVPIKTESGHRIGSLCVLDMDAKSISLEKEITSEKIEMLTLIAAEIVQRLKALSVIQSLQDQLHEATSLRKKVLHDIRGPIGGIIGLAQIINDQEKSNTIEQILEMVGLIHQSGTALLELADEILNSETIEFSHQPFNLLVFKEKLLKLYSPQAKNKDIHFAVNIAAGNETKAFSKDKLLQIVGNLISNAIKFTPRNGFVTVNMAIIGHSSEAMLNIIVKDSGVGLSPEAIAVIVNGTATTTKGTVGEKGFGFGLALVKHLVDKLNGTINITSVEGEGTSFEINLPQGLKTALITAQ
ncbi:ATP-binding protein [uncultured Mucilaginibacter sp.]|uniref:GAF domain-containing sensor histidine kinase n=1 Tax=uncultured Mucilaginibacter sp. TaxID=797541 RepID=UPI00260E21E1|nr:ATP-binding protein [uncultured Mucilaginibacter sp.]